ncbi:MAG: hypothetical protein A2X67_00810 [Ignavibacteria bacterium GWA2_55_11]|nr:MAG: hypothetical protein A2X67_00810 [Ignavibacteria bacterium GWA2_55_11]OGU47845.1 MAG: hypothetical protein A2X68_11615 [Ignavibacteria bacterium GWC2_56_12]OGU76755.1 MAG: hypothetical protein A3G43_11975 [Ignavibacteria bacterium RIFCSPLOWO2_12_FULL_56_21]HAV22202.1 RluA family pseudouridine synthase [Bacteroidota bacterium]
MQRLTAYQLRSLGVGVLIEDGHILALNKPSGLLVLPDRYDEAKANLIGLLTSAEPEMYVVHRLDRETSGVIVLAKTKDAHASLNAQFEARSTSKVYHAVCKGEAEADEGIIDMPLSEHSHVRGKMRPDMKNGKDSITSYRVLERFDGFVSVEARPKTGRTHQIRVHLAQSGMPIVGDGMYGDGVPFKLSAIKRGYKEGEEPEKPLLERTALHAYLLTFRHPASGEEMTLEAPLPKDMRSVMQALRKYAKSRPAKDM